MVRSGGMKTLFGGVYAPSTIGTLLREFSFGHARQLESVLGAHLVGLCVSGSICCPARDARAFVDIDSLLRPVYGQAKQGASYGHTKIAGKQVLRKGLSPLATTISTDTAAPVIAGTAAARRAGPARARVRGAWWPRPSRPPAPPGITGQILVRGDSAYGTRAVVSACRRAGAQFSLVWTKNTKVQAAINAIAEDAWIPVRYPGAVHDPDTGAWISDAEVAEIPYTAFTSTNDPVTARLVVRRVKDAHSATTRCSRYGATTRSSPTPPSLSPTPTSPTAATRSSKPPSPTSSTDPWRTSRPGGSAPTPPGYCARRSPITCYAPPQSWPAAATAKPAGRPCAAHWSTSPPAWPAPNANRSCTYPATGPGNQPGMHLWHNTIGQLTPRLTTTSQTRRPEPTGKAGQTSGISMPPAHRSRSKIKSPRLNLDPWIEA